MAINKPMIVKLLYNYILLFNQIQPINFDSRRIYFSESKRKLNVLFSLFLKGRQETPWEAKNRYGSGEG